MGDISSEVDFDQRSERSDPRSEQAGSYSVSADISESESFGSFSGRLCDVDAASSSLASSPLPRGHSVYSAEMKCPIVNGRIVEASPEKPEKQEISLSEVEMMKERFAKLLLGEDMSGGGKGVSTALAISNAITNLSATVFGELWRLEPLAQQKKSMWRREMEWLLCVGDYIVELIPSSQDFPGGGSFEIMIARPRTDLYINLPALKKLDALLLAILDGFQDTEFWYADRGILVADAEQVDGCPSSPFLGRPSLRQEEKWWLPCPMVPHSGLSSEARKRLQQCRDCGNQILKAALAVNSSVLSEMVIPDAYFESLPKTGKACLGDIIYRYIKADQFSPECLLDCLDLSSEHQTLEIANRIEAAMHVWNQKHHKKQLHGSKIHRSTWGGKVKSLVCDGEKSFILLHRVERLLQSLKHRFPGLPQTVLDMNKIQYNKDVGQSILESYSRVLESLAFNIIARIDDILYVDDMTRQCSAESISLFGRGGFGGLPMQKKILPSPFSIQRSSYASPFVTPTFCSSTPVMRSPSKAQLALGSRVPLDRRDIRLEKWAYAGNLSSLKDNTDAPECH